jgi:hypothetical protein
MPGSIDYNSKSFLLTWSQQPDSSKQEVFDLLQRVATAKEVVLDDYIINEEDPPIYDDYDYAADDEWFSQPAPCYCTDQVLCRWCFNEMRQRLESLTVENPIR